MTLLREDDAPIDALLGKRIAILGFGAQGHAHALNLRESGIEVIVATRPDGPGADRARKHAFEPVEIPHAVRAADLIIIALPDELQPQIFARQIAPNLRAGQALGFIHGFNIHFNTILPPRDVDVLLVAPKGPGHQLRDQFVRGGGLAGFFAIHQNVTGHAREIALAWARGIGCARIGLFETTFMIETEADLFGEQAVLCGGVPALIKAGFQTLVDAGYPPQIAWFECVHEVKLIVDLIYEGGLSFMLDQISNTAAYGGLTRGPRLVTDQTRAEMREMLFEITNGTFAREWLHEHQSGMKKFAHLEHAHKSHLIEHIGSKIREAIRGRSGIRTHE